MSVSHLLVNDEKVFVLQYKMSLTYVLGTSHTDHRYVLIVNELIRQTNPEVVGVELCRTRMGHKNIKRVRSHEPTMEFSFEEIPKDLQVAAISEKLRLLYAYGAIQYTESKSFRVSLQKYSDVQTYKLQRATEVGDIQIGAELLAPFKDQIWHAEARNSTYLCNSTTSYKILLLDRPVEETYSVMAKAFTDEEKRLVRRYKKNFVEHFMSGDLTKPRIMATLWKRNPKLKMAFVHERDEYMAKAIFKAITKDKIKKLVCIVGKAHVAGLLRALKNKSKHENSVNIIEKNKN